MEFLKCRDVRWKGPEKRNKPDVVATTAKHPESRSQISRYDARYGWMQPTYMRSVSFWGKFTSGSRIRAVAVCLNSLICHTLLLHDNLAARLAALALQLAAGVCSVCVQLLVLFWNIWTLAGSKVGKDFVLSKLRDGRQAIQLSSSTCWI